MQSDKTDENADAVSFRHHQKVIVIVIVILIIAFIVIIELSTRFIKTNSASVKQVRCVRIFRTLATSTRYIIRNCTRPVNAICSSTSAYLLRASAKRSPRRCYCSSCRSELCRTPSMSLEWMSATGHRSVFSSPAYSSSLLRSGSATSIRF